MQISTDQERTVEGDADEFAGLDVGVDAGENGMAADGEAQIGEGAELGRVVGIAASEHSGVLR